MTCFDIQEIMSGTATHLKTVEQRRLVEAHLQTCDACRADAQLYRRLRANQLEPSEDLQSEVLTVVRNGHFERVVRGNRGWRSVGLVAAACLATLVAVPWATHWVRGSQELASADQLSVVNRLAEQDPGLSSDVSWGFAADDDTSTLDVRPTPVSTLSEPELKRLMTEMAR